MYCTYCVSTCSPEPRGAAAASRAPTFLRYRVVFATASTPFRIALVLRWCSTTWLGTGSTLPSSAIPGVSSLTAFAMRFDGVCPASAAPPSSAAGGGLDARDVATAVQGHLSQLSDAYLEERLGGALTAAQNTARAAVFKENGPERYYASELLDSNTCSHCVARDGTQYADLMSAERDYPSGGYKDCEGFERCRGLVVGVYAEESDPTMEVPDAA